MTHDIAEALKLGTKVLVMDKGQIQQYDEPNELLRNPKTDFVKHLVNNKRHTCFYLMNLWKTVNIVVYAILLHQGGSI